MTCRWLDRRWSVCDISSSSFYRDCSCVVVLWSSCTVYRLDVVVCSSSKCGYVGEGAADDAPPTPDDDADDDGDEAPLGDT